MNSHPGPAAIWSANRLRAGTKLCLADPRDVTRDRRRDDLLAVCVYLPAAGKRAVDRVEREWLQDQDAATVAPVRPVQDGAAGEMSSQANQREARPDRLGVPVPELHRGVRPH